MKSNLFYGSKHKKYKKEKLGIVQIDSANFQKLVDIIDLS